MKVLNSIITVCFVVAFAGAFYFTKADPVDIKPKIPVKPPLNERTKIEEQKSYTEPAAPAPPKQIPMPTPTAMVQEGSLIRNEYVRGAIGAVIGWIVKNICEVILGLIKKLSFIKNLGW